MKKKIIIGFVIFCFCFLSVSCSNKQSKKIEKEIYDSTGKVTIIEGVAFDAPAGWTFEEAKVYDDPVLNSITETNALDIFTEYSEEGHISFDSSLGSIEETVENMITVDGMIDSEVIKKNEKKEKITVGGRDAIRMTVDFIQNGREKHLDYIIILDYNGLNHMFLKSPIGYKERAHNEMNILLDSLQFTK